MTGILESFLFKWVLKPLTATALGIAYPQVREADPGVAYFMFFLSIILAIWLMTDITILALAYLD